MLNKITIRNFKRFGKAEIELGNPVVFTGPNNSGKTSAMQALALWDIGVKRWHEKRSGGGAQEKKKGVTVNRRDLVSLPVPHANLLWHGLHTRDTRKVDGAQRTDNIRIDIIVEGTRKDKSWVCGLEFDYTNPESFYCRPLRLDGDERMPVPAAAVEAKIAFLPPMSGLAATETRLDDGAINVRIGEGRTAEVLRNLCYRVQQENPEQWEVIKNEIQRLFGVRLNEPRYIAERGEVAMDYKDRNFTLDLSSSGRGLQQTLLLLAYMGANPGAVLLLDEPDAHLEILRQRQTYKLISDMAADSGSQVIAASHSEVLLNEAADRDSVIAFIGNPHPIIGRGNQLLKALESIGFEQYYLAEQKGWVLYLEGSTDWAVLQAFARHLKYDEAVDALQSPFVHYVGNQPMKVAEHFHGIREALPNLQGVAIFDRLETVPQLEPVVCLTWKKREIENYLCTRATLEEYVRASVEKEFPEPLFRQQAIDSRMNAMRKSIGEISRAMETLDHGSPWDADTKASDHFLTPLFRVYFEQIELPNLMAKKSFYELAEHVPVNEIDPEIREKLDAIVKAAKAAKPG
ncbi:MAG: AAA family ATPase [Gammaproteobacteria bacterium]|nr:AAA family ATPase [Gammaproteobacteria bacterium]